MKFIKKHIYAILGISAVIVVLMLALISIIGFLYPDDKKDLYGNRLDGMDSVKLSDDKMNHAIQEVEKTGKIESMTYNRKGRIINFHIDVKKEIDVVTAKAFSDVILKNFSEKEKTYYDIQIFITCKNDDASELYPIIGYKHKTSVAFKWTNN